MAGGRDPVLGGVVCRILKSLRGTINRLKGGFGTWKQMSDLSDSGVVRALMANPLYGQWPR